MIVIDQVKPEIILQKIGGLEMAFAESFKGEGAPTDGNFQDFNTSWRREEPWAVQEIWLEMLIRNLRVAVRAGYNFCEFWGWPEVRSRDDGTCQVASRLRIIQVVIEHKPRIIQ